MKVDWHRNAARAMALAAVVCSAVSLTAQVQPTSETAAPTEREIQLQQKVDDLERRLAALEAASQPAAKQTSGVLAISNPVSPGSNLVDPVTQTPQEHSQAAENKPAEPFAFADFTWLNEIGRA